MASITRLLKNENVKLPGFFLKEIGNFYLRTAFDRKKANRTPMFKKALMRNIENHSQVSLFIPGKMVKSITKEK